jgi:CP family cyanate transporter-like MFS transporter
MRSVILAVPPVLPAIRSDLHLSYTLSGALTAIPVVCLGAAAIPGALLAARLGPRLLIGLAMLGLGAGALLRLPPPAALFLFGGTVLMSLAVATAQPAVAVLVRGWFPARVQATSTAYGIAMAVGALIAASLTVYLLPLAGWRGCFLVWALPPLAVGLAWLRLAPRDAGGPREPHQLGRTARGPLAWYLAALFGCQSMTYFGASTWIPFLLGHAGAGNVALTLLFLNAAGLPLQVALAFIARPWARSRLFYVASGALLLAGSVGFLLELHLDTLAWFWASLLGIGGAMNFSGAFALPPLAARSGPEAASLTAIMMTAGYAISFLGPLLGGILLDRTGVLSAPFALFAAGGVLLVLLGVVLPRRSTAFAQLDATDLA